MGRRTSNYFDRGSLGNEKNRVSWDPDVSESNRIQSQVFNNDYRRKIRQVRENRVKNIVGDYFNVALQCTVYFYALSAVKYYNN